MSVPKPHIKKPAKAGVYAPREINSGVLIPTLDFASAVKW